MTSTQDQLDALSDIRNMMDRSSRFISLSGLSGVFAGITALVGAHFANLEVEKFNKIIRMDAINNEYLVLDLEANLIKIAVLVLIVALAGGIFFTYRQSKKNNLPIWDRTSKNLLLNLFIPLAAGGLFIIALLLNTFGNGAIISSLCLIFYGLALVNASKYTYSDIRFLGICQIVLGLINMFSLSYGLYFWAFGFGILHIVYGALMYFKYERAR